MVSMLQMLEMEDGMRRGAFTIVVECFDVACLTVHCLWNRATRMSASDPIAEAADSKKPGDVVGGVKDNGASLDC